MQSPKLRRNLALGKRDRRKPTAIDLFSGCGGLTLGLRQAGFSVVGCVEIDPLSVESYRLNHHRVRCYLEDIRELDARAVRRELKVSRGELGLVAGCPPCQGFSRMRTRNRSRRVQDQRNPLVFEFLRFVEEFMPRAVMLENVPGMRRYYRFREFHQSLADLGYRVRWDVFDAADFGVAQRRKRLILIAARGIDPAFASPDGDVRTVREAIADLPKPGESDDPLHDLKENRSTRVAALIRKVPKNGGSRADLGSRRQLRCHKKTAGFYDVYGRMAWNEPAPTLTAGFVNPSKGRFLHPQQNRTITLREAALLQSFPSTYRISLRRGKFPAAGLIGNAFPPELVRRHAREIRGLLDATK